MFKYHKQLFLRKHVDKKSSQAPWSTRKRKRGKKQRMRNRSGLSNWSVSHSVISYTPLTRKVCYCSFFFLLTIVHSWTQGETNNRLTLRCDLATQFVIPFLGHKHMKIKGPKDSDLPPVRISVLTFTKYHM